MTRLHRREQSSSITVHTQPHYMKTKPVKRYRQPRYPTRLQVISDPDLLARNVPPAWRSVPGMAGTIALFLAANSLAKGGETKTAAPAGAAAVISPIFDHGEGRGGHRMHRRGAARVPFRGGGLASHRRGTLQTGSQIGGYKSNAARGANTSPDGTHSACVVHSLKLRLQ